MAKATVNGLSIGFELLGDGATPWVLTPGGRFPKETPGLRQLGEALVAAGDNRVLIWDRPNCGESDLCFSGTSESQMQADTLAALLTQLDLAPAVVAGGSAGSRISLLTASAHPEVVQALALWWISGGVYGLMGLATHYCGNNVHAAWGHGMEAVADLAEWKESLTANPGNRDRILAQDRAEFIETMERWMAAYCPRDGQQVPGLPDQVAREITVPALVFRSGESDAHHTRTTSEAVAALLPASRLVEPPWGDREWIERGEQAEDAGGLFVRWPLLAPALQTWADEVLP